MSCATSFREEFEKSGQYKVVEKPAADVLYLRVALSDLMLQKKKRPVLAYIPVAAVAYGARKLTQDMDEKIDLTQAKIESELLDSVTNEPLGAYVLTRRTGGDVSAVSWDDLSFAFSGAGKRLACRLANPRVPEGQRENCQAIPLTKTKSSD